MTVAAETRGGDAAGPVPVTITLVTAGTPEQPFRGRRVHATDFLSRCREGSCSVSLALPPLCLWLRRRARQRRFHRGAAGTEAGRAPVRLQALAREGRSSCGCRADVVRLQAWGPRSPRCPFLLSPPPSLGPQTSCFASPTLLSPAASSPALRKVSDRRILTKRSRNS